MPGPIRRSAIAWFLAPALGAVLAGCGAADAGNEASVQPTPVAETADQTPIRILGDSLELAALQLVAQQFEADTGITVTLVQPGPEGVREAFVNATAAQVPDIVLGSHDWLGELVGAGLIQSIDLGNWSEGFTAGSITAFDYLGEQFGVPYSQENVALVCTTSAMPDAPSSFAEVVEAGLAISLNDGSGDPYHLYALQAAFGATIFETDEAGSYTQTLNLDDPAGYEFAVWLAENASVFDLDSNNASVKQQLIDGDKGCWVTGPWNAPWFNDEFGEEGWHAYSIPSPTELPAAPFSGVRGAMLSSQAANPSGAAKFLGEYFASDAAQRVFFENTGRTPVKDKALESAAESKIAYEFASAGLDANPVPALPAMNFVWVPLGAAQVEIIKGEGDAAQIWSQMCDEIAAAIASS